MDEDTNKAWEYSGKSEWRRRRTIILTLTRSIEIFDGILHDHMRCVKYLMVEVELAPLFKDTESDIPKYGVWGITITIHHLPHLY